MNNQIIGIISDNNTQLDMLVWSLYFLSGQEKNYYSGFDYWFDLPDNPIQSGSGEIEIETDGSGDYNEVTDVIEKFKSANDHPGIKVICTRVSDSKTVDKRVVEKLFNDCDKVIVVGTYNRPPVYKDMIEVLNNDFIEEYFADSIKGWDDVKNTTWDKREILALSYDSSAATPINKLVDLSQPHFFIDTITLYSNLKAVLSGMFKFLKIDFVVDRLTDWETINTVWTNRKSSTVHWDSQFSTIVDYIINGYEMDLTPFNLDLVKESFILRELIYKHNRTIKGYNLEELPRNTKEIHNLLEPNFHPI